MFEYKPKEIPKEKEIEVDVEVNEDDDVIKSDLDDEEDME